ncbi:MAG: hypothetical protein LBH70_10620, partial [Spirochaetaceae bacterium]|nr:hypothetical protein [Spirochaetaceae bacterium]
MMYRKICVASSIFLIFTSCGQMNTVFSFSSNGVYKVSAKVGQYTLDECAVIPSGVPVYPYFLNPADEDPDIQKITIFLQNSYGEIMSKKVTYIIDPDRETSTGAPYMPDSGSSSGPAPPADSYSSFDDPFMTPNFNSSGDPALSPDSYSSFDDPLVTPNPGSSGDPALSPDSYSSFDDPFMTPDFNSSGDPALSPDSYSSFDDPLVTPNPGSSGDPALTPDSYSSFDDP